MFYHLQFFSSLNTDLGSKQASIKGGASTITENNLIANRVLVSNASGKVVVSTVTAAGLEKLTDLKITMINKTTTTTANAGGVLDVSFAVTNGKVVAALLMFTYGSVNSAAISQVMPVGATASSTPQRIVYHSSVTQTITFRFVVFYK